MFFKLFVFCFLYAFTLTLSSTAADDPSTCTPSGKHDCKCKFSDGTFIDLKPINPGADQRAGKKWRFDYVPDSKNTSEFAFNPCFTMKGLTGDEAPCNGSVVCQRQPKLSSDPHYNVGNQSTENFEVKDGIFYVTYEGSHTETAPRKAWIKLICDRNAAESKFAITDDTKDHDYYLTLTSKYCCATSEAGLSLGSILCILFVVILVVYLVGGILFNKFVRGATGVELIPNRGFWTELPALIKEGFQFTAAKITGLFNRNAQYDQI